MPNNRITTSPDSTALIDAPPSTNGHANGKATPRGRSRVKADALPSTNGKTSPSRGPDGKFLPGNAGGTGNPFARQVARFRSQILQRVSEEQFDELIDKLVEVASQGDVAALKLLFSYLAGKPTPPPVEPDEVAVHEMDVFEKEALVSVRIEPVIKVPHPELPLNVLRGLRPELTKRHGAEAMATLNTTPAQRPRVLAKLRRLPTEEALAYARRLAQQKARRANRASRAPAPSTNGTAVRRAKQLLVPKSLRKDKRIVPRF